MTTTRTFTICLIALAVTAACSGTPERPASAAITGPSPLAAAEPGGGGVSRPALVDFPARPDVVDFRTQLESKYVNGLGRRPAQTIVDMEGEATWVGEYNRYRINGCDHDTATQRALAQVDGAAPAQVCSARFFPETAVYPPRDHVVDFRRQLGAKYQAMGRSAQSAVDPDGAAIWISEYLRYRTSGCDHATAVQKTLTQIDGTPTPATCVVQCAYNLVTPVVAPSIGATLNVELIRTSGSCDWLAESEATWIHLNRPITGSDRSVLSYNVDPNTGPARSGTIRFNYPGAASFLTVNQGTPSNNLAFQFIDPSTSSGATTECRIRTASTICTLNALTPGLPTPIATYDWHVEYVYNGTKVKAQAGSLASFSFTETCGPAPAEGAVVPISVRLIATDIAGNVTTLNSGQGTQPPLQLRIFSCQ